MNRYKGAVTDQNKDYFSLSVWLIPTVLAILLITISFFNFLLFHTLAEFFAITIAILTCVVAWNMYPFTRNNYLMYLGVGYFWIGILDLLHAMSYKGMHVFPIIGSNTTVQFWIGTRYIETFLLLSAPWFLRHSFNRLQYFVIFGILAVALILLINMGFFPEAFVEGKGLTAFKINSEYIIIIFLAASIFYLYKQKKLLDRRIINVMIASILLTMCAELAFTFYVDVYGLSNLVGHIFKIFSFWLIFQAIIRTTLHEPFMAMSRGATTYDAVPDATVVIDEEGIIRQANNKACMLSHIGCIEIIGQHSHDLFHPENLTIEDCPVCQAIINNKELTGLELKINEYDHWFDFSLSRITGSENLNGTVEVIRDITQGKMAQEKVKELDTLKNSIIENLPSTLFVKDAKDLHYVEWNKAAEELTGLLKEEMVGHSDFDFWPKEQAQLFIEKDKEVIREGKLHIIPEEQITSLKGMRIVRTKKIPIFNDNGEAKYLLGIADDITEKLKIEEMLRRSQKMEAVGQMSGGIAHDFNNQLGVILGYADLLSLQDLTDDQHTWINAVREAAKRCSDLTRQLLIFSRKGVVDKESLNLNKLLAEMNVMIERSLTPEVDVKYLLENDMWESEVNTGECKDAILNLVLNARDAMPNGGSLVIETKNIVLNDQYVSSFTSLKAGEYIQITVSDTGMGISQDVYEHVFEPFYTTKDVGKGTGLGLSMVYGFVQRYGGDILLDTKLGEGTTFKIYLPRSLKQVRQTDEAISNEKILPTGHESILIVDDEPGLLFLAEELLKSWGYTVYTAENPTAALKILNNSPIDLLFTDVVMPGGMNGYELAEKGLGINPELKVLLVSGYAEKLGSNEKYDKYDFKLIAKPYKKADLAGKIRQIFDE